MIEVTLVGAASGLRFHGRAALRSPGPRGGVQAAPGVTTVQGAGQERHIGLKSKRLGQSSLREFIALHHRFGGTMSEPAPFENASNTGWLRAPAAFWHGGVFAAAPQPLV